jgi:hypothetical protein
MALPFLLLASDKGRVIPKKFFVVMPFGSDQYSAEKTKNIAAGVLDGVLGISDKAEIIMQWYGMARDAILAMDGPELVRLNSLSRIQYDNPEYLVSNGMAALYRVFNKSKDVSYGPKGLAGNLKDHIAISLKEKPLAAGLVSECKQVADALNKASVALESAIDGLPQDPDDRKQVLRETGMDSRDLDYLQKAIRKTEEDCRDFAEYAKDGQITASRVDLYLSGEYSYERWTHVLDEVLSRIDDVINYVTDYGFDEEVVMSVATLLDVLTDVQKTLVRAGGLHATATKLLAEMSAFANIRYKAERGGLLRILEDASEGFKDVKTVKGLATLVQKHAQKDFDLKGMTVEQWTKLLRMCLESVGSTFKSEGEWLVKDRKLKIPPNSTLWISKYPLPEDVEARRQAGETTKMDDFVHGSSIKANDDMDRLIKDLNLEQRYTVRRIDKKKFDEARSKWIGRPSKLAASTTELYHTTSLSGLSSILKSGELRGHPFVSLSEIPYTGDISFNDVTIVFDAKAFGDSIEKVQYTQDWFDSHGEQASYIAGDGWAEQYEVPEDCFDEEGFEDTDCSDRAYREAEFMSFTHKSREREWISKNRRPLSFPESAVLRVIVHKDNMLSAVEEVLSTHGYTTEAVGKGLSASSLAEGGHADPSSEHQTYNINVEKLWKEVVAGPDARWGCGNGYLYFKDALEKLLKFKDKIDASVVLGAIGIEEDEIDAETEIEAKYHASSLKYWFNNITEGSPPLELLPSGHVWDGYHRLVAAMARGVDTLPAITINEEGKPEQPVARLMASSAEAPKDFRLMFRLPNKDVPDLGEQLARGVLKGVAGITDSGKVLMLRMLGQNRNAMLVMPGTAVLAANDLERVEYDNPDYLMANDMAVAQRIMGQSHTKQSTIERILREAASFRSPVKDFMTTWGNLDVFPSEQLAEVPLDSALDFAAELFALSKPKVEEAMQRNAELGEDFVQERYGPLLDPDNYLKAVNAGLLAFGRSFIWEGEWLVNNKTLRIPDGSRLFVMKEGSLAESAKQAIEQYQLDDRYPVRYVDASKMERAGYALGQHAEQLTKERWKLSSKALDISSPVATMPAMPTKKRKVRANVPLSFAEAKDAMADAVEKSASEGIPVALGGGFAMQAYGSDRLTQDVDLIATKLPSFAADGDDLVFGGKSVDVNGIPIDVIVRADDYADLYEEAVQKAKPKAGYAVKIITPEYLVAMKMVAGRPKDDLDLNYLLSSVKMDMTTLKSVVQRFLGRYAVSDLASRIQEAKWMKKAGKL